MDITREEITSFLTAFAAYLKENKKVGWGEAGLDVVVHTEDLEKAQIRFLHEWTHNQPSMKDLTEDERTTWAHREYWAHRRTEEKKP
jgi:hypothetical protein